MSVVVFDFGIEFVCNIFDDVFYLGIFFVGKIDGLIM